MTGKKRTSSSAAASGGSAASRRRTTASVASAQRNQPELDAVQCNSEATAQDNTAPQTLDEVTTPKLSKHIMNLLGSEAAVKKSLDWLKAKLYDPRWADPPKPEEELKHMTEQAVKLGILPNLLSCISAYQDEEESILESALIVLEGFFRDTPNDLGVWTMAIELDVMTTIVGSMKLYPQCQMIIRTSIYSLREIFCVGPPDQELSEDQLEFDNAAMSKLLEIEDCLATILNSTDSEELKTYGPANRNLMNLIFNIIECDSDLGRKYKVREMLVAEGAISKVAKVLETFTEDEDVQKSARDAMYSLVPNQE